MVSDQTKKYMLAIHQVVSWSVLTIWLWNFRPDKKIKCAPSTKSAVGRFWLLLTLRSEISDQTKKYMRAIHQVGRYEISESLFCSGSSCHSSITTNAFLHRLYKTKLIIKHKKIIFLCLWKTFVYWCTQSYNVFFIFIFILSLSEDFSQLLKIFFPSSFLKKGDAKSNWTFV